MHHGNQVLIKDHVFGMPFMVQRSNNSKEEDKEWKDATTAKFLQTFKNTVIFPAVHSDTGVIISEEQRRNLRSAHIQSKNRFW